MFQREMTREGIDPQLQVGRWRKAGMGQGLDLDLSILLLGVPR